MNKTPRLDNAVSEMEYVLDCLIALRNIWKAGHDCNTCTANCEHRQWGKQVTYNCPLWEGEE